MEAKVFKDAFFFASYASYNCVRFHSDCGYQTLFSFSTSCQHRSETRTISNRRILVAVASGDRLLDHVVSDNRHPALRDLILTKEPKI